MGTGRIAAIVLASLMLASCQPRDRTTVVSLTGSENLVWKSYTMAGGGVLKAEFDYSVNAECAPTVEQGVIRVITEPAHGKLSVTKTEDFPEFKRGDPRWQCNKKRVPGTLAVYRPDDGFTGEDFFKYDHYTADGRLHHMKAVISVN
jgi:hypothetical protein